MNKKLQKMSKNKRIIVIAGLIAAALVLAIVLGVQNSGAIFAKLVDNIRVTRLSEIAFTAEDLEIYGVYNSVFAEDGMYSVTDNDPQIAIPMSNQTILTLRVSINNKQDFSSRIQVYYADTDNYELAEQFSVLEEVPKGKSDHYFKIDQMGIDLLRLDIGDFAGEQYEIEEVVINEDPDSIFSNIFDDVRTREVLFFIQIYSILLIFILLHFILDVRKMYSWILEKRWILAAGILAFLTLNCIHGDSIGIYDYTIQPGMGSEYVDPIWGQVRTVRSDEFLVDTPSKLAGTYGDDAFGKYNTIQRGTETLNVVSGLYLGYPTIAKAPYTFAYALMDVEYAFSFCWYAPIILAFMLSLELCLIITNKKKLLSLLGACLIVCSTFFLWWGFPSMMIGAQGAIVCGYYFLKKKKLWHKILTAIGLGVSFASFVLTMYPAWMIPMAYIALVFVIWILHDEWESVKQQKVRDWLIFAAGLVFAASFIVSYFVMNQEYVSAITNTVYPGHRVETGGFGIPKIFNYIQGFFYGFFDLGNPCENSGFLCFFPIPAVLALYYTIKNKKKDWLLSGLLIFTFGCLIFLTVGFPPILAKITLLERTTMKRLVDLVGLAEVYILIRYLGVKKEGECMPVWLAAIVAAATTAMAVFYSVKTFPDYLNITQLVAAGMFVLGIGFWLMVVKRHKQIQMIALILIVVSLVQASVIRPVSIGLDAIYSKPLAKEIKRICEEDPDAKWIACSDNLLLSGFMVACGASTLNSVNVYPNMELWEMLDETGEYEECYNRYAHVAARLVDKETTFSLMQVDMFLLELSYDDLEKIGCNYICTDHEIPELAEYGYELEYSEGNSYIYHCS